MKTEIKENSLGEENQSLSNLKKINTDRPNIDHLIKRILVEQRRDRRKSFLTFAFFILLFILIITISI